MNATVRSALTLAAAFIAVAYESGPASAYTEQEIQNVFRGLDTNGDGKVTKEEYAEQKVRIVYRNIEVERTGTRSNFITFEQSKVTRQFFDAADKDRDGRLSGVEVLDALPFENVDTDKKGYIAFDDLLRFMNRIGR